MNCPDEGNGYTTILCNEGYITDTGENSFNVACDHDYSKSDISSGCKSRNEITLHM